MADNLGLNSFDLIVIGGVLLSSVLAFSRGLMRELLSLASWIAGILAVFHFAPRVSEGAAELVESQWGFALPGWLAIGVAGLLVFLVVMVTGSLVNSYMSRMILKMRLSLTDKLLGFLFGAVRGVAVLGSCYFLYSQTVVEQPDWLQQARTRPVLDFSARLLVEAMRPLLPKEGLNLLPSEDSILPGLENPPGDRGGGNGV